MQADEKVVARLKELRPLQHKANGGNRNAPEVLEFDKLLVDEIERGVSAVELASLLGYKTSQGVSNRYNRIKKSYSIGFTQTGEVKSTQKYRVGRPKVVVDESGLEILAELEIVSKDFHELEEKLKRLTNSALDSKIPAQQIADATGVPLFRVKYLAEKRLAHQRRTGN
jgi:hypothetical protein